MSQTTPAPHPSADRLELDAVPVTLFGHDPASAHLELERRTRGWRLRKAAVPMAMGLAVAPLVAVFPPHAPWAIISVVTGVVLARRRWAEEFTIRDAQAPCPRCGASLGTALGGRLRTPHPVTCDECGHEPVLEVDEERLREIPPSP